MPQPINIGYAGDQLLSRIGATGIGFQSVIADDKGNPLSLSEAFERMEKGERLQLHRFGSDGEAKGAIPIIKRGKEIFQQETDTRAGTSPAHSTKRWREQGAAPRACFQMSQN